MAVRATVVGLEILGGTTKVVGCDFPGCAAVVDRDPHGTGYLADKSGRQARAIAKGQGWLICDGSDYCPAHIYTCAKCGETFPKGWSDEEALAEAKTNWGDADLGDPICDDCHKEFLAWMAENHPGTINN